MREPLQKGMICTKAVAPGETNINGMKVAIDTYVIEQPLRPGRLGVEPGWQERQIRCRLAGVCVVFWPAPARLCVSQSGQEQVRLAR